MTFDQLLEEYVYKKIWSTLSEVEKNIVKVFNTNGFVDVSFILEKAGMKKEYFSRYRERLLNKGILYAQIEASLYLSCHDSKNSSM